MINLIDCAMQIIKEMDTRYHIKYTQEEILERRARKMVAAMTIIGLGVPAICTAHSYYREKNEAAIEDNTKLTSEEKLTEILNSLGVIENQLDDINESVDSIQKTYKLH